MILVDTSVWINHLKKSNDELVAHLNVGSVACHTFIIGELACGNLSNHHEIFSLLHVIPATPVVEPSELLDFIETRGLMGKGLGYVDMHLLASAVLSGVRLWTADRRLREAARGLGVAYGRS